MSSRSKNKGFTLIELLVSVIIMALITAIVVSNDSTYSERTSLRNTADSVALAIREAQTYGISVRETSAGSGNFDTAYGVEFNTTGPNNKYYILYSDLFPSGAPDGLYDQSNSQMTCNTGNVECRSVNAYAPNNLTKICYIPISNNINCNNQNGQSAIRKVDITFKRPNTNIDQVNVYTNAGNWQPLSTFLSSIGQGQGKGICLEVSSPSGLKNYVNIYTTGQISVDTQCL